MVECEMVECAGTMPAILQSTVEYIIKLSSRFSHVLMFISMDGQH